MANSKTTFDVSAWKSGLDKLKGPLRTQLARSMAVAGGKVLRDEAKGRAPKETGQLAASIYLAYRDNASTEKMIVYSVSWNAKTAPHGHLIEFGHWQVHPTGKNKAGEWVSNKNLKLKIPHWVPAQPYLRPTLDNAGGRAREAMLDRGRERLPELLAGAGGGGDES